MRSGYGGGLPAVLWAGTDGSAPRSRRRGWTGCRRGADSGRGWGAHGVPVAAPAPPRLTTRCERAKTTSAVVATLITAGAMTSLLTLTFFTSGAARYLVGCAM